MALSPDESKLFFTSHNSLYVIPSGPQITGTATILVTLAPFYEFRGVAYAPQTCSGTGTSPALGYYCPGGANSIAQPCAAGSYAATAAAALTCSLCPAGNYTANYGQTSCPPCPAGKYCAAGTASPPPCPAGFYCPAGVAAPIGCAAGNSCPAGSSVGTAACVAGFYCPASTGPTQCPPNTYNSLTSQGALSSCIACPSGWTTTGVAISQTACIAPLLGYWGAASLIVLRVGDFTACPSANSICTRATPVYLDEYNMFTGAIVSSQTVPGVTLSGNDQYVGAISRSANGGYAVFGGQADAPGTAATAGGNNWAGNRVVVRIKYDQTMDASTQLTAANWGGVIKGACSADGTGFWVAGNATYGCVVYVPFGSTTTVNVVSAGAKCSTTDGTMDGMYTGCVAMPDVLTGNPLAQLFLTRTWASHGFIDQPTPNTYSAGWTANTNSMQITGGTLATLQWYNPYYFSQILVNNAQNRFWAIEPHACTGRAADHARRRGPLTSVPPRRHETPRAPPAPSLQTLPEHAGVRHRLRHRQPRDLLRPARPDRLQLHLRRQRAEPVRHRWHRALAGREQALLHERHVDLHDPLGRRRAHDARDANAALPGVPRHRLPAAVLRWRREPPGRLLLPGRRRLGRHALPAGHGIAAARRGADLLAVPRRHLLRQPGLDALLALRRRHLLRGGLDELRRRALPRWQLLRCGLRRRSVRRRQLLPRGQQRRHEHLPAGLLLPERGRALAVPGRHVVLDGRREHERRLHLLQPGPDHRRHRVRARRVHSVPHRLLHVPVGRERAVPALPAGRILPKGLAEQHDGAYDDVPRWLVLHWRLRRHGAVPVRHLLGLDGRHRADDVPQLQPG